MVRSEMDNGWKKSAYYNALFSECQEMEWRVRKAGEKKPHVQ